MCHTLSFCQGFCSVIWRVRVSAILEHLGPKSYPSVQFSAICVQFKVRSAPNCILGSTVRSQVCPLSELELSPQEPFPDLSLEIPAYVFAVHAVFTVWSAWVTVWVDVREKESKRISSWDRR